MGEGKRLSAEELSVCFGFVSDARASALRGHIAALEAELAQAKADVSEYRRSMHEIATQRDVAASRAEELEQHISDLEKSLENARKARDEWQQAHTDTQQLYHGAENRCTAALKDRDLHAQSAEVWRKRVEQAADALADVLPGEVGRLDLLARISALKADVAAREFDLHRLWDGLKRGEIHTGYKTDAGAHLAEAMAARLKPSGQVAEDAGALRDFLQALNPWATDRSRDIDLGRIDRLAVKAQGYEAAVEAQEQMRMAFKKELDAAQADARAAGEEWGKMKSERDAAVASSAALLKALDAAIHGRRFGLTMPHPGTALLEQHRREVEALKDSMKKAAAELRHTYGHLALGQSINPDLVARAIRILEEASR